MASKNPSDRYFAARPKEEIGQSLANRLEEECGAAEVSARAEVYATAYEHYYGFDMGRGPTYGVTRGGEQGELSEIRINKAAAVLKSFLSLVIGPRVNWRPQAASGAQGARSATILSINLLEWAWKRGGMERVYALMAEMGLAWSESFVAPLWDTTRGPIVSIDPETDLPVRGGDIRYVNLLPWDVVRDSTARSYADTRWKFLRLYENKWDLMKLHPEDVCGEPTGPNILAAARDEQMKLCTPVGREDSDLVPVWYFFHEPTPSLPEGLEVVFVSGRCVLRYRTLSYGTPDERSIPLVRFAFDELFGTPYAYSRWWDTLGPQEVMDGLQTSIATNQLTLGTQSVAMEQGTEIDDNAVQGMKSFVVPRGGMLPQGINLVKTPAEVFEHVKQLGQDQQQLLNLNDTFRGQPDTAQMNAQAFTVLATQAIQQNSPVQRAALDSVAQLGTKTIQTLAERVTDERKVRITGKQQKYLYNSENYTGGMLRCIDEVFVDIGNPIEQTAAGRFTLAQMYQGMKQQNGEPVTVDQIQQVIDTGRIEPVIQSARDEQMLIENENDKLSTGKPALAHALDNHLLHGRENLRPILNPEGRADKAVNEAVLQHIHEHYVLHFGLPPQPDPATGLPLDAYQTAMMDPQYFVRIRTLLGQPAPMDMAPPPMPGAQDGTAPPQGDPAAVMGQPQGPLMPAPPAGPPPTSPVPAIVQPGGDLPLQ